MDFSFLLDNCTCYYCKIRVKEKSNLQTKSQTIHDLIDNYQINLSCEFLDKSFTVIQNTKKPWWKHHMQELLTVTLMCESNLFTAIMIAIDSPKCHAWEFGTFSICPNDKNHPIKYAGSSSNSSIQPDICRKLYDMHEYNIECLHIINELCRQNIHNYINDKKIGKYTKRAIVK